MTQWPACHRGEYNAIHGQLLYIENLILNTIDWSTVLDKQRVTIEAFFLRLFADIGNLPCLPIRGALFGCVSAYLADGLPSPDFRSWAVRAARRVVQQPRTLLPAADNLAWLAGGIPLAHDPSPDLLLTLLAKPAEQDRLSALWAIPSLPTACLTLAVFEKVLEMATGGQSGDGVQINALNTIASTWASVPWDEGVLMSIHQDERIRACERIGHLMKTRIVPMKEAALPALAWSVVWAQKDCPRETNEQLWALAATEILDASSVTQVRSSMSLEVSTR